MPIDEFQFWIHTIYSKMYDYQSRTKTSNIQICSKYWWMRNISNLRQCSATVTAIALTVTPSIPFFENCFKETINNICCGFWTFTLVLCAFSISAQNFSLVWDYWLWNVYCYFYEYFVLNYQWNIIKLVWITDKKIAELLTRL